VIASSPPGGPFSRVYTGLAVGNNGSANFLYAADIANGKIDVFNSTFTPTTLAGNFTDTALPALPADYHPFNVQALGGELYVAYAKVDPRTGLDIKGFGAVSVFDFNGVFKGRLGTVRSLKHMTPTNSRLASMTSGKHGIMNSGP